MSDIGILIPWPIALAFLVAVNWPVTLGVAAVLAALGAGVRTRWVRATCFVLAGVLVADCLLALLVWAT